MTILIASDHAGFQLKEQIKPYLKKLGLKVKDLGAYSKERCDYPEFAYRLARQVSAGKYKRGILVCKSGIGNSIVANRLPGVHAALCYNLKAAKLSREHNNSNVLVLASVFTSAALAKRIANTWLKTKFKGGRYQRRLKQIQSIEKDIKRWRP
ncbi:MAG: ribose 5-phosphate isomerase B [Candidatus Omnitrophota bacterium]|jgi:ribose 5-phosphate isomerase B